ncbi:hypothetical protein P43SY_005402 [Pythium insidiosum]|uniref:Uncharacterized protein n=1 Tax=Pythium insidiosum TaxID=114742 RepID=A0AAD5LWZ7_PYTIN|nr:hypothetical protein P43SY_005402 [Pythium insidiosum]
MPKKKGPRSATGVPLSPTRSAPLTAAGDDAVARGRPPTARASPASPSVRITAVSPPVGLGVVLLSKNQQQRIEFTGETLSLGELYLNDLSDIRVFELTNHRSRRVRVSLRSELRKPFHGTTCNFQLENENLDAVDALVNGGQRSAEFLDDDFAVAKRMSFDEIAAGDLDEDDEFEFDGEPRPVPRQVD